MKKLLIASVLTLSATAHADVFFGAYGDINYWQTSSNNTRQTHADNREKLDNKSAGQLMVNASVEHGVPMLPNARVRYAGLNAAEKSDSNSKIAANSLDVVAYYELLDSAFSADVGLGVKRIGGNVKVNNRNALDLNKTLPMAYASVGADLPLTGLSAKAELGYAKGKDAQATDFLAEVKYDVVSNPVVDVGVKAGYRSLSVNYDKISYPSFVNDTTYPYKMNFQGPYIGVEAHF